MITPIFIHFNLLHLIFNMYWLFALGTEIEFRRKSWRFLLFVFVAALVSNVGQFYFTRGPSSAACPASSWPSSATSG